MTDNEIIKALDGADVFLRNRANSKPAPLNEYDIEALIDIANVCDEAANLINRQKAEIMRLTVNMNAFGLGMKREAERADTAKAEAIKEFAERLKEKAWHGMWEATNHVDVDDIDNLVKEMVVDLNE